MYTTNSYNIRQGASTEHDVIGTLNKGQAVAITGKINEGNQKMVTYQKSKNLPTQ